jgi:hypothetical protein
MYADSQIEYVTASDSALAGKNTYELEVTDRDKFDNFLAISVNNGLEIGSPYYLTVNGQHLQLVEDTVVEGKEDWIIVSENPETSELFASLVGKLGTYFGQYMLAESTEEEYHD